MSRTALHGIMLTLILCATEAPAQHSSLPCREPASEPWQQCLKSPTAARDVDFCLSIIREYIEDMKKWRSCALEGEGARHASAISDIIERTDRRVQTMTELLYCVASTGKRNPACPF